MGIKGGTYQAELSHICVFKLRISVKIVPHLCSQPEVELVSNGSIEAVAIGSDVSYGQPKWRE